VICGKHTFWELISLTQVVTVKQAFSVDMFFPRLGDFAVPRILIFADAGTEHSSFIVLLSHISYSYWTTSHKTRRQQSHFVSNSSSEHAIYYWSEAIAMEKKNLLYITSYLQLSYNNLILNSKDEKKYVKLQNMYAQWTL